MFAVTLFRRVRKIAKRDYYLRRVLPPVCLPIHLHETPLLSLQNFHKILCLSISCKPVEKIQVLLKSGKNNWYFTETLKRIYDCVSLNSS
jgi:hypothetical protein